MRRAVNVDSIVVRPALVTVLRPVVDVHVGAVQQVERPVG
jgi:hypothetical protein